VPGIPIPLQFRIIGHSFGPERIEMNISDQFQEIRILLAKNGSIPVLKEVTMPSMPIVKGDRISR